jgi:hypothetical protein
MVMLLDSNIDIRQVKSKLALFLFWKIFICQIYNACVYVYRNHTVINVQFTEF